MRKRITSISCLKTPILLSSVPLFVYNPILPDNNDVNGIGYLECSS